MSQLFVPFLLLLIFSFGWWLVYSERKVLLAGD
jgi:hypothetical protein